jgi:hypothetical protein
VAQALLPVLSGRSETPKPLANICITSRQGSYLAFSTSEMYDSRTPDLVGADMENPKQARSQVKQRIMLLC